MAVGVSEATIVAIIVVSLHRTATILLYYLNLLGGTSAAVVLNAVLISQVVGWDRLSLYDGSWTEWKLHSLGRL